MTAVRVYRLVVSYPDGSHDGHGQPSDGWHPPGWVPKDPGYGEGPLPFQWPRVRLYLSRNGAEQRAALLRDYGALVWVVPSMPVEWAAAP